MNELLKNLNSEESENVLVHMNSDEVGEFSRAQQGEDINQELGGIPQFIKLGQMLDNPKIKEALRLVIKGYTESSHEEKTRLNNEMDSYLDDRVGDEDQFLTSEPQESKEIKQIESLGVEGDNQLVLMPKKLLYFIWDNVPPSYRQTNPNTGFPQFSLMEGLGNAFSMISNVIGGGLIGYGIYDDYQNQKKHQSALENAFRQDQLNHEANQRRHRTLLGLNTPYWGMNGSYEQANNPRTINYRLPLKKGGRVEDVRELPPMTKSMYIKGVEPGQDDNIYIDVPKGSRILDARTVADIGDGNSEAGAAIILDYIHSSPIKYHKNYDFVKCALSAGELGLVPEDVEFIGKGNLDRGHKKLDNFVKKLRSDKKHSIHTIPKKTKSIEYYLGKNLGKR